MQRGIALVFVKGMSGGCLLLNKSEVKLGHMCQLLAEGVPFLRQGGLAVSVFCAIVALLCHPYEVREHLMRLFYKRSDGWLSKRRRRTKRYLPVR